MPKLSQPSHAEVVGVNASEAMIFCCSVQIVQFRTKIYAAPPLSPFSLCICAPTMMVVPDMETELPKLSKLAASNVTSF